jgi:hypothetical protein
VVVIFTFADWCNEDFPLLSPCCFTWTYWMNDCRVISGNTRVDTKVSDLREEMKKL